MIDQVTQGSRGQALTEFLILCAILVPLFLAIPLLAGYGDIKYRAQEATRYAVWERTVWSPEAGVWKNGDREAVKPDALLQKEVDRRIFGHPLAPVWEIAQPSETPLWNDHKRGALTRQVTAPDEEGEEQNYRVTTAGSITDTPVGNLLVDQIAADGVPFIGDFLGDIGEALDDLIGLLPGDSGCSLNPIDFRNGLNLSQQSYAKVSLEVPLEMKLQSGEFESVTMRTAGGVLSNVWSAPDEPMFDDRIGRLVLNDLVECVSSPISGFFGFFALGTNEFLYGEVRNADPVPLAADASVLLPVYRR